MATLLIYFDMVCFALDPAVDTVAPAIIYPSNIVTTSSQASWHNLIIILLID